MKFSVVLLTLIIMGYIAYAVALSFLVPIGY